MKIAKKNLKWILRMTLNEMKAVCKELEFVCNKRCDSKQWYIYTPNCTMWITCYYLLFEQAIIFNLDVPTINDKDEFKEGLQRKLKEIKEESIKDRIKSLEKDFV